MAGRVNALVKLMHSKQTDEQIQIALSDAHERDIAAALEQLDAHQRARLYRLLGIGRVGDVFSFVGDAGKYLRELPQDDAASIVEAMDADDAVDALETVSKSSIRNPSTISSSSAPISRMKSAVP